MHAATCIYEYIHYVNRKILWINTENEKFSIVIQALQYAVTVYIVQNFDEVKKNEAFMKFWWANLCDEMTVGFRGETLKEKCSMEKFY